MVTALNNCCPRSERAECCSSVSGAAAAAAADCKQLALYLVENYARIAAAYVGLLLAALALLLAALALLSSYAHAAKATAYWQRRQFSAEAAELQRYASSSED